MSRFPDKYRLTREQSLFLAKKKWDENIYCGMKMENRNVTFPQTQTILQGFNVGSVSLDDIQAILNMRDAWKHTLKTIDEPVSVDGLCAMNGFISRNESLEWGVLRTGKVGITGVGYVPPIPERTAAAAELAQILDSGESVTAKAIDLFLWGARSQLFWDGNKRTSLLAANKTLVAAGAGMLIIKEPDMADFNTLLTAFYESGDGAALARFLYDQAITGMTV